MNIQGGLPAAVKFGKRHVAEGMAEIGRNYTNLGQAPLRTVIDALREQVLDLSLGKTPAADSIMDGISSATQIPPQVLNVVESITHPAEGVINALNTLSQYTHLLHHIS